MPVRLFDSPDSERLHWHYAAERRQCRPARGGGFPGGRHIPPRKGSCHQPTSCQAPNLYPTLRNVPIAWKPTASCRPTLPAFGSVNCGNSPDPAEISPESGVVKYGLVAREHTGEYRVATKNVESRVLGTFLAQMVDRRTIKLEVVAGSHPAQVDGFSQAAKIYHR